MKRQKQAALFIGLVSIGLEFILLIYLYGLATHTSGYSAPIIIVSIALLLVPIAGTVIGLKVANEPSLKIDSLSYHLPYTAKATKDFWVFPFLGLGLTLTVVGANSQNPARLHLLLSDYWMGIVVFWLVMGIIVWAASSHRIVLTRDRIVFHEVLSKTEVLYSQISRVEVGTPGVGASHIEIAKIESATPDFFSLALCSSKDCVVILNIIAQYAPQAKLGPNAVRLKGGELPFIF